MSMEMGYVLRRDRSVWRSSVSRSEAQKPTASRVDTHGRHFETTLSLSDAMLSALLARFPLAEGMIPRPSLRHLLFIAIDRDPPPRDLPFSSKNRFLCFPSERLQEVHVAEVLKDGMDFAPLDLVTCREIEKC